MPSPFGWTHTQNDPCRYALSWHFSVIELCMNGGICIMFSLEDLFNSFFSTVPHEILVSFAANKQWKASAPVNTFSVGSLTLLAWVQASRDCMYTRSGCFSPQFGRRLELCQKCYEWVSGLKIVGGQSYNVMSRRYSLRAWIARKRRSHHFDEIFITGGSGSCQNDNSTATSDENFIKWQHFCFSALC